MKIKGKKIVFEFEPTKDTYWLFCEKGLPSAKHSGMWWLAPKIDRSEKGKDPDIAVPEAQLSYEEKEEILKKFKLDQVWD